MLQTSSLSLLQFSSRTRNLLFYGLEGGKDLFRQSWRDLMSSIRVECDGVDLTERLAAYGAHSVIFLNIRSYAGGTRPWNRRNGAQVLMRMIFLKKEKNFLSPLLFT